MLQADQITSFRTRVASLRQEWQTLAVLGEQQEAAATKAARQNLGKLRRGLRTPEEAYRRPILEALGDLGGQGSVGAVLDVVFQKMKSRLNEFDLQPLASGTEDASVAKRSAMVPKHAGGGRAVAKRLSAWGVGDLGRRARMAEAGGATVSPRGSWS
ncbi:MAG: hypothetical protein AMXMBFR81_19200 [Chthonomonas sp.]